MTQLVAISGSLRTRSSTTAILRTASTVAPPEVAFEVYEGLGGLPHFNPDFDTEESIPPPTVAELRARLSRADGLLICTPEYAHGMPGSLKNGLDWLVSTVALVDKPVVAIAASPSGGAHAYAQLIETLTVMSWRVLIAGSMHLQFSHGLLDPHGEISDPTLVERLRHSVEVLAAAR